MPTTTQEITSSDDMIDVRDVIARFEELETTLEDAGVTERDIETVLSADGETDLTEESEELTRLAALLEDLCGNGGDEQWKGDWYPITLIRDSYFEDYAQELADDIGAINSDATWPNNCIDWERAARETANGLYHD